jgi:predicted AlkP superfamily pyrophosphatase or phosphodiesterase
MNLRRLLLAVTLLSLAQVSSAAESPPSLPPRLIVIVSVDQLAYEYLERFKDRYSEDGFFKMVERRGAWYSQAHHRHAYTVTAPGHSVLMTGSYPNVNGIVGNDWYDRHKGKSVYCVEDSEYPVVGTPPANAELKGVSPKNLKAETVGDVLKRVTNGRAKVFGVTLKDRAAVLMTGAKADGAYWYDGNSGCWVTSRYYRQELPEYVRVLNQGQTAERFAGAKWELSRPLAQYRLNYPDDNTYEGNYEKLGIAFPHQLETNDLPRLRKQIPCTPFGNELALTLAEKILTSESLGQDDATDVLAVGFSSNDYVGHTFGPHSLEVEDMCYRTDEALAKLVKLLDQHVGEGRWTLALSADHAVCPVPEYAASIGLPARRNPLGDVAKLRENLTAHLEDKFGPRQDGKKHIERLDPPQLFLTPVDDAALFAKIQLAARDFLSKQPGVLYATTRNDLLEPTTPAIAVPEHLQLLTPVGSEPLDQLRRAFNPRLGGDVVFTIPPYSIQGSTKATHGTLWKYDSHIPVLLLGHGIRATRSDRPVSPAAIAPTFAKLLGIPMPAQNVESPLDEALAGAR